MRAAVSGSPSSGLRTIIEKAVTRSLPSSHTRVRASLPATWKTARHPTLASRVSRMVRERSSSLASTIRLKPFHDPDDGRTIVIGETVAGNIDFHFDWDWYSIRLEEGETVTISTDSTNVDTLLYVDFPTPATIRWSLTTTVEEGCSG